MKTRRPRSVQVAAAARWIVFALAVAAVVVGLLAGQQLDVFWKAATVCLECIGIA